MDERWVCKRCFNANSESSGSCTGCGLIRGAEVAVADQAAWQQARPASTPRSARLGRPLRFWWVPVIGIGLLIGYVTTAQRGSDDRIASAGSVQVSDLRVGDCFNADEGEIEDVHGVPCGEPHAYELYFKGNARVGDYPNDEEWDAFFLADCLDAFDSYVGISAFTTTLDASMLVPTQDAWSEGDRSVLCYVYDPAQPELTESLRDAAR